ncbi:MAG: hypothetical protein KDK99_21005 [Verrucomicrobiales bacterium]|nr:hypothetical protein [Verrucomicrobiales bacterium]
MIHSRAEYLSYLEADRQALGRVSRPPLVFLQDPIWYFQRQLRRLEFLQNTSIPPWLQPLRLWTKLQYKRSRLRLGFHIPPNTIGPGLNLVHEGDILVHERARIGSHLRMNIGVVIGIGSSDDAVPTIGNHVVIEPGAKIFGAIRIADWTHIGANAVVNRDVEEPGKIVVGIPARVVKPNPAWPGASA